MVKSGQELLELLMTGHKMTPDELDKLLEDRVAEDLFLDYKHGDELDDSKKAKRTIREYLSAFANSAGGVLIIGVDEQTWSVTGCSAPGGVDLAEWASSCLTPIAPHFSPSPRFQVVGHPEGNVLIAATDRSLTLIPCIDKGELTYYLRIHDQTLKAPEYLVSDILLGKRRHPYLEIIDFSLVGLKTEWVESRSVHRLRFDIVFNIENNNLVWVDDVIWGFVGWSDTSFGRVGKHLLSYIEKREPEELKHPAKHYKFVHYVHHIRGIKPFDVMVRNVVPSQVIILDVYTHKYRPSIWRSAIYLNSEGSPPVWYQINFIIPADLRQLKMSLTPSRTLCRQSLSPDETEFLEVKKLSGDKPIISWEMTQED